MKNSVLCFGLFLAGAAPTWAQTVPTPPPATEAPTQPQPCAVFSGRVSASEKPLAGVTVAVKGTHLILITNEEGFFTLPAQITQFPTLAVSAAGYAPIELTLSSCTPVMVELQLLPGTRIKQRGKRKGFIMKTGQ